MDLCHHKEYNSCQKRGVKGDFTVLGEVTATTSPLIFAMVTLVADLSMTESIEMSCSCLTCSIVESWLFIQYDSNLIIRDDTIKSKEVHG